LQFCGVNGVMSPPQGWFAESLPSNDEAPRDSKIVVEGQIQPVPVVFPAPDVGFAFDLVCCKN
jgi:hypothetical protein